MRIRWTRLARADIGGIQDYIGERNPNAAELVEDHVLKAVERLLDFPHLGRPGRREGTRELVISGLPYIVVYIVRERDINLLRVLHGAQLWPED